MPRTILPRSSITSILENETVEEIRKRISGITILMLHEWKDKPVEEWLKLIDILPDSIEKWHWPSPNIPTEVLTAFQQRKLPNLKSFSCNDANKETWQELTPIISKLPSSLHTLTLLLEEPQNITMIEELFNALPPSIKYLNLGFNLGSLPISLAKIYELIPPTVVGLQLEDTKLFPIDSQTFLEALPLLGHIKSLSLASTRTIFALTEDQAKTFFSALPEHLEVLQWTDSLPISPEQLINSLRRLTQLKKVYLKIEDFYYYTEEQIIELANALPKCEQVFITRSERPIKNEEEENISHFHSENLQLLNRYLKNRAHWETEMRAQLKTKTSLESNLINLVSNYAAGEVPISQEREETVKFNAGNDVAEAIPQPIQENPPATPINEPEVNPDNATGSINELIAQQDAEQEHTVPPNADTVAINDVATPMDELPEVNPGNATGSINELIAQQDAEQEHIVPPNADTVAINDVATPMDELSPKQGASSSNVEQSISSQTNEPLEKPINNASSTIIDRPLPNTSKQKDPLVKNLNTLRNKIGKTDWGIGMVFGLFSTGIGGTDYIINGKKRCVPHHVALIMTELDKFHDKKIDATTAAKAIVTHAETALSKKVYSRSSQTTKFYEDVVKQFKGDEPSVNLSPD